MKDILVTGAYGGMGKATINLLSKHGFRIFALDKSLQIPTDNIIPIKVDITSEESINNAMGIVKTYTNSIFAIIHFAGIYLLDSLVEIEDNMFKQIFDVNLHGAFLVNKIFFPFLKKGSRIIITTSELASLDPLPFTGIYAITKSALDKYAYSLRMELQLLGISVSVLRAGAVKTEMLDISTKAVDNFCANTSIYTCNAHRFKNIVDSVESRSISSEAIGNKIFTILKKRSPVFVYNINRNPLLLLFNILPKSLQLFIIRFVLRN